MTFIVLSFLFIVLSSASACDRCLHQSKATYTSQISSGSCGYDSLAFGFNGGLLAGGLPSLFKQGAGCGACFKVRCKNPRLCRREGTRVMLTELQGDNRADFVLNKNAYVALANKGKSQSLLNLGIVDIEYKRVPCDNKYKNLAIRVENYSSKPYYLAFTVLHQGGQTEILGIDVAQVGSNHWASMKRNYGAVWDTNTIPSGPLKLRFLVKSGFSSKYVLTQKVLPADWKSGLIYDVGTQITHVAQEECSTCRNSNCTKGTKTVVTDVHTDKSNTTDFVLSSRAFRGHGLAWQGQTTLTCCRVGIADVKYKRVPCVYKGQKLGIHVEEFSKFPNYLAIKVLYQGGQTTILGGDVASVNPLSNWASLSRNYGAVWDTHNAPRGNLTFRFIINSGFDARYFHTSEDVLPANWKPGDTYNSTEQISDVAVDGCAPCKTWK